MIVNRSRGVTLIELLVVMAIFGMFSSVVLGFIVPNMKRLSFDKKLNQKVNESRRMMNLLRTELRMAASPGRYMLTTGATFTNCSSGVKVSGGGKILQFLVFHDHPTATGQMLYHVGYELDTTTKELFRGSIPLSGVDCSAHTGIDITSRSEWAAARQLLGKDIQVSPAAVPAGKPFQIVGGNVQVRIVATDTSYLDATIGIRGM